MQCYLGLWQIRSQTHHSGYRFSHHKMGSQFCVFSDIQSHKRRLVCCLWDGLVGGQGRATGRSPNKGEPGTNGRWREGGWGGVGWGNGSHAMIHVMCSDIFTRPLFRRPLFAIRNLNGAIVLCYSQRPQRWGNGRHGISHVMCVRPLFSGPLFAMVFVS